jgi:hypothetical protein
MFFQKIILIDLIHPKFTKNFHIILNFFIQILIDLKAIKYHHRFIAHF